MRDRLIRALSLLPLEGALVYGSVARGTATARSDIDLFVLLASQVDSSTLDRARREVAEAQVELGYRPDPDYPVEIFTVAQAKAAVEAHDPDEDQTEVIRALTDEQVVLIESPALSQLIATAQAREGEYR